MFDAYPTQELYSAYITKTYHDDKHCEEYIDSLELQNATIKELLAEISGRLESHKTVLLVVSDRETRWIGVDYYAASFNSLKEAEDAMKEENIEYFHARIVFVEPGNFIHLGGYSE